MLVTCNCGSDEPDSHYLNCAVWISILSNHVSHDKYRDLIDEVIDEALEG